MKHKKGLLNQIYIVVILVAVLLFIIGLFSLGAIVLPIFAGQGIEVAGIVQNSLSTSGNQELEDAGEVATSTTINVLGGLELLVYLTLIGLVLGYIMIAYYVRTYPFLAFFWIGALVGLVIIAMIMSNAYETAKTSPELEAFYSVWGTNDFLMSYLPHLVAFIGIIGGIVLFGLVATNDSETETRYL
jgi:hypothetical protein